MISKRLGWVKHTHRDTNKHFPHPSAQQAETNVGFSNGLSKCDSDDSTCHGVKSTALICWSNLFLNNWAKLPRALLYIEQRGATCYVWVVSDLQLNVFNQWLITKAGSFMLCFFSLTTQGEKVRAEDGRVQCLAGERGYGRDALLFSSQKWDVLENKHTVMYDLKSSNDWTNKHEGNAVTPILQTDYFRKNLKKQNTKREKEKWTPPWCFWSYSALFPMLEVWYV